MEQGKFVLKQESHLKKGIKPIFACLIEDATGGTEESKNAQELIANNKKIDNVDFDGNYPYLKGAGYLVGKSDHTYIISPVSESNKFSEGYVNCTGVVVSGKDNFYFDNENRRAYFVRPKVNNT